MKLKNHPTGTEEAPIAISYTYLLEEADYLYHLYNDSCYTVSDRHYYGPEKQYQCYSDYSFPFH